MLTNVTLFSELTSLAYKDTKMLRHDIELTWWQKLADLFYDFGAVVISVVDVATDTLITIQFGLRGKSKLEL